MIAGTGYFKIERAQYWEDEVDGAYTGKGAWRAAYVSVKEQRSNGLVLLKVKVKKMFG
eukprot:CAMPEP_0203831516 /NCGR_PEP_ID=MMETSP0115-20131106/68476_1 /ASSEMBLY_ACC=CAM_ASM_000227 /TAXON_ID=33651 /ORGANISM="Bicosoecid sp, Strain ms1" /LENGTH=57 /DNA_ID=CAMNT_0050740577 /DNA_START=14 /DNA_END=183 /DNA_ORIENTATION=-